MFGEVIYCIQRTTNTLSSAAAAMLNHTEDSQNESTFIILLDGHLLGYGESL